MKIRLPILALLSIALGLGAEAPARADRVSMAGGDSGGQTAPAAAPAPKAPQPSPTLAPDQVAPPPGQVDYYERANENLALQAIYNAKRIDNLRDLLTSCEDLDKPSPPGADGKVSYPVKQDFDQQKVEDETQGYCSKEKTHDEQAACLKGFIDLQSAQLERVRHSLQSTQDSIGGLRSTVTDTTGATSGSKVPIMGQMIPKGKKQGLLTQPSVPKFADLSAENAAPQSQWIVEMKQKPKAEDYANTADILMNDDPQDKTTFSVTKRTNGVSELNKKKFKEAELRQRTRIAEIQNGIDEKHVQEVNARQAKDLAAKKNLQVTPSMRKNFLEARKVLVDAFNQKDPPKQKPKSGNLMVGNMGQARTPSGDPNAPIKEEQVNGATWNADGSVNEVHSLYLDPTVLDDLIDQAVNDPL